MNSFLVSRSHILLVIAHRGASAVAPESTRAAIRAAVRARANGIELDVQMTRDGRLVVFHDDRLERTTNGRGRLTAMPYHRLQRLDAGAWFGSGFAGERILLLSQALRLIPRPVLVNLELKRTRTPQALIPRLLRVIRQARAEARLLISSFDARLLRLLRGARLARALITRRDADRSLDRAIRLGCVSWHPHHTLVTAARVARAHEAGLRVHAWTVDQAAGARRLIRLGVDGLFANDPARLRQELR